MKVKLILSFITLLVLSFYSCSGETVIVPKPDANPKPEEKPEDPPVLIDFPNEKVPQLAFTADGGKESVQFYTIGEWEASLSTGNSNNDWIRFSPSSGEKGYHIVEVVATANDKPDKRQTVLCLITKDDNAEIPIIQEEMKVITINKEQVKVDHVESFIQLSVTANVHYEVQIDVDWITPRSSKILAETQLVFLVSKNGKKENRTGKIIISAVDGSVSRTVTVLQLGKDSSVDDWGDGNNDWWKPNNKN